MVMVEDEGLQLDPLGDLLIHLDPREILALLTFLQEILIGHLKDRQMAQEIKDPLTMTPTDDEEGSPQIILDTMEKKKCDFPALPNSMARRRISNHSYNNATSISYSMNDYFSPIYERSDTFLPY